MLPFTDGPLLGSPTFVTSWPDNSDILVVAERSKGIISVWDPNLGVPKTLLDLGGEAYIASNVGEFIGVTGIAFHPHFNHDTGRRFIYVRFNAALANQVVETRIKRYEIAPGTLTAQASTATTMYTWPTQATEHGSGTIQFDSRPGSNPVLYAPMPDDTTPGDCSLAGRVQDIQSDLGKLLSIDVSAIPPLVKQLATGLRNPFGFSVDRGQAGTFSGRGDVWIGDVGAGITGSILRWQPGGGFKNYGWPWYEGNAQLVWTVQPQVIETIPCGQTSNPPPPSPAHLPLSAVENPHAVFSGVYWVSSGMRGVA